ncbi:MAG: oligosaccharyl transferase, archaeosortase A system-associated [bacterium]
MLAQKGYMPDPLSNRSLISNIIPKSDLAHCLLLFLFGALMLFIRIIPNYTKIFTNWPGEYGNYVNFAADDAIYHMRFIHNTIHHFPWRVFFDPFTHFPFGSYVAFGPLFTIIIATVALIAGFGHPSHELINHISAYVPPVMAMLCLIPVYLIVRKLFGKTPAIISAFILTFSPGEFLGRSTLGFVDHHVAEVLFSTTTCAFLIYALAAAKSSNFTLSHIKHQNNRTTLIYGLLCGISFGLFILTWQGASLFGAIFLIFFITQLLIDHTKNSNTDYLLFLASSIYIPSAIIVLPYVLTTPLTLYPANNIPILAIIFVIFAACYLLHITLKRNQLANQLYPLALAAMFALVIFILNKCFPQAYALICYGCKLLFHPTPGMATISEVHPTILNYNGKISAQLFWTSLFWTMPLTIVGIGYLGYRVHKNPHPAEVFLFIWTLIVIAATCAQLRFNYYLAISVACLSGLSIHFLFGLTSYSNPTRKFDMRLQKFCFLFLFFFVVFLIINPILQFLIKDSIPCGPHITREWYNTLIWLKNHTPNPQGKIIDKNFDYTAGYYPVPKDLKAYYNYPKNAYGIMSWWDSGHQITYIAKRIPNATPFQDGVVEKDGKAGAAPFFTTTSEEQAIRNLEDVGSRYVIIDKDMATKKFMAIAVWSGDTQGWYESKDIKITQNISFKASVDSPKFSQSMMGQLYYNDANGLQHFRLIHEDEGGYFVQIRRGKINQKLRTVNLSTYELLFKDYNEASNATKAVNQLVSDKDHTTFAFFARSPVKLVKIFEKVKGAIIDGKVPHNISDNTQVKLKLQLKTKYDRIFIYEQTTKVNKGKYSFVVPYPTTKMYGADYSYDIEPTGNYQIQVNKKIINVFVPENAIVLGANIKAVNF